MGLGISFSSAVIVGYVVRELVYWIFYSFSENRLRSKVAGRIFQIITVTIIGVVLAPLTLDFVSIGLSGVYIILLLLDIWVAERVLEFLQKAKNAILQSPITKFLIDKVNFYLEKARRKLAMDNDNSIEVQSSQEVQSSRVIQKTPSKVVIIIQNVFVFSLKIVIYQFVVRTVVLGASIGLLHIIEKTTEVLIDHFVDALVGPIGTQIGHGCNTVIIKVPRIVLEKTRELLDLVFDGWHIIHI